ncbi:MAG: gliding motility-associated C-terminal domain-containing protein, partial [Bacteroidia bacterium]|nr:gliding motility-associated C-terminal domain-containing protein [Bacteroidia bacterium]
NVTINANPVATATSNSPVCVGKPLTLTGGPNGMTTYSWSGPLAYSNNTQSPTVSASATAGMAGIYTITVTNGNGCTSTATTNVVINAVPVATATSNSPVCIGQPLTLTGGPNGMTTYSWSGPLAYSNNTQSPTVSASATAGMAGIYTITVTNGNGCTSTASTNVTVNALPVATATSNSPVCIGQPLTLTGGPNGMTSYSWSGPLAYSNNTQSPTVSASATAGMAGIYTITVTNGNGCTSTATTNVVTNMLSLSETHINTTCYSLCDGSIDVEVSGGTAPYTYNWTGPLGYSSTNLDISALCAGVYNLTVSDISLCSATISVTITEPTDITLSEIHGNIAPCFGLSNGWITVTAIGGTGVYTYDWSPDGSVGDGTATYSSLIAGSYTVTVNDIPNGCSKVLGPIDIIQPPDITVVSVDITDALCFGGSTGAFTVHASGGSPPYQYNIGTGYTTDSTFTNLLAGSYTVTVRDVPGCTTTQLITIGEPTVLTSTISQTDPICTGVCSGTATVTPAGGTGVYTYIWDNPAPAQTTQTATGLCVGLINVTITDSNGCSTTNSTTINAPSSFTASISDSSMSCGSFPTLVAGTTFLPDGTGASYTTTINQTDFAAGSTINSINDISSICLNMEHSWAGDLEIKITCPNNQSQILKTAFSGGGTYIGEPVSYNYPDDSSHIVIQGVGYDYCFVGSGAMFGTMGATSNTFTYTYTDNASNIHNNRFYLPAGTYTPDEAFTNLIGCPINGNWTITVTDNMGQDNGYIFSWQINYDPSTYPTNYCNGSATVTANGGQAPYTYYWSNGATTPAVTDICSGNYCVTITDFIGCTATTCVTITDVNLNIDSFTVSNPSCNGVCNGSITANISGGFAPITYAWSNGQVTQTISNLCAGQYIVTVTEVNGCTATDTIDIINSYSVSTSFPAFTNVACGNTCTGSLTVDATGGGTSYTYTWNPNVGSTATINNLCAGFYFVTVTDNFGCTDTNNFEITDPSDLELSLITSTNPLCFGDCNGSATLLASGGTPPYIISWPGGGTGTNLCDGDYIVTVTDINLCSDQLIVSMVEPQPLSFSTTITDPVCFGDCNGTATATVIGGTLPYSYQWCNGQNTQTATGLCDGICNVTVSDINSCIVAPQTVTITNPPQLTGTLDITQNITCSGSCNGILTTNHSGGVAPFTYIWSPNITETTQAADSLCAGTYFVTITDFNGCSIVVTQTLNQPQAVTAVITDSSQVGCHGNCSGTATVLAGGGTGPYTYFWEANTNGYNQITTVADSLCAGTFTVTITDFNLCTAIDSVTIIDTSNLSLSLVSSTNPLCNGNCNGDITVIASGGYPNLISPFYTYTWSNDILNNQPFDNALCSGSYFITVSDDSLCSRILQVDLIDPPLLADSTGLIPITCSTLCDGSAIVFPYGGTGSYSYLWDAIPSQINDTIINLCPNVYHVTVSDANNCTVVDSVTIIAPPAISANITIVDSIACHSDCNGSILANVIGGTPPYTYTWNNTLTNDTLYDLCAGIYDVTVKDANLCSTIATITLGEPDTLQISFNNITQIACGPGNCTGTATAAVIGGSAPYTYTWSANTGGQTDSTAINLCGDIYSVTATDTHGCTIVGTVTITDNSTLSIFISDTNHVTCSGACDGSAVVSASGATPPYTYIWDDSVPTTIDTVINLCQGTYYVTVYDANLCSRIDSVVITNAAALTVSDSIIPISCSGLCNASISLIPSGGTPPYITYQWSIAGETDSIATGLCPGTYYYTVTDFNNCQFNDSVTIVDPGSMMANITVITPIQCHGVCTGSLLTSPSGSLGPYTYLWSDGQTDSLAINLCGGEFHVTVTGQGGCFVIDSINFTEPDSIVITFDNIVQVNCGGDSTGSVTAVVIGGIPLYNYQWDANAHNATTAMIDSLKANLYFITVTDAIGCSQISSFELTDTSQMVVSVDSMLVSCYGRNDGWAKVTASGGTPTYSYDWDPNGFTGDGTDTYSTLIAGTYIVTVSDFNLCSRVKLINITQPDSIYISIVDSSSITCASVCNGSLTVNVFGGTSPYTYLWNNSSIDTIASNLCAGIQQLNISDSHNCQDSLTYNLISPPVITTIVTPVSALCNNNATDGVINVIVSGGVPQYSFLWSNDSTTQNITGLLAGNYWLTITDSLGCIKIDSATIGASIIVNATARWDSTICYGDSVQIFGFGGGIYSWSPSTGLNDSSLFNPWANPLQTTTYYFTVWDSICFDIDSVTIQVYPQIILDAGPDQTILSDHSATLTATSPETPLSYLWNPTLWLTDSVNATTIATPLVTTTYYVFATNLNGCVESDSVTITVIPKIIVPTGITPNGDGSNDVWMIDFIDRFPDCEVEIYNRWGEKLFYSKGYPDSERWDGTFKGKALPTGTYYYIINLHDEFDTKPLTGPITIMR